MPTHADLLRLRLAAGPQSGTQMAKDLGISQPTVSRALAAMAGEVAEAVEAAEAGAVDVVEA